MIFARWRFVSLVGAAGASALLSLWVYAGLYGLNILVRHGGTWWLPVGVNSTLLSPSMRLALEHAPIARPSLVEWRKLSDGFEVADLEATVDGHEVDRIQLARIDPARFRFAIRTAYRGDTTMDAWIERYHPVLIVNGSYTDRYGQPATPLISNADVQGPSLYDARAGAFVSSPASTVVRDLRDEAWQAAFQGSNNAMVSFPLLIADGKTHVSQVSRWLANRSFVGQDHAGRVLIGTTTDAFFSLDRLARFLLEAPLDIDMALNLDGGPVASQSVALNGFDRRTYGRWEAQVEGDRVWLLAWPYGQVAMPIALMVFPK